MSESCCSPQSKSTQSQKTETESCCELHPPQVCGPTKCPQCQQLGKTVKRITLGSLIKPEKRSFIPSFDEFCFCRNPQCDVVYFRPEKIIFRKDDLSVPAGIKEPSDSMAPVCYCFGWTPHKIHSQIKETGKTTAIDEIKAQVKAGNCYCEMTNPQGSCCLGNVSAVVKEANAESRNIK